MNAQYQASLNQLKKKIEFLVSHYEHIKAENVRMADELTTLKQSLKENKTTTSELEHKINRLQIAEAFKASSSDVKEAKQKIGRIIKEIDKCLALLNN